MGGGASKPLLKNPVTQLRVKRRNKTPQAADGN